jgi:hypothetical protein
MSVRGTTRWQHARIEKRVINRDEGGNGTVTSSGTHYVICAFGQCDNDGYELYKVRINTAENGWEPRYMNYVFCSEKCKQAWLDELHKARRNGSL